MKNMFLKVWPCRTYPTFSEFVPICLYKTYPGGLRPDRRTQEVSLQSVSFVVMLWNVELFALLCAHRFLFPVSVVFLLF